jgi:hypothetical protein
VAKPDHVRGTSGSWYFVVSDVAALRKEFIDAGAKPGAIEGQEHDGKNFPLFFLKEDYDDCCFCLGPPAYGRALPTTPLTQTSPEAVGRY